MGGVEAFECGCVWDTEVLDRPFGSSCQNDHGHAGAGVVVHRFYLDGLPMDGVSWQVKDYTPFDR